MTIQEAIDRIDETKPNMFSDQQKVAWLSEVDSYIFRELIKTHEGSPAGIDFVGYDLDTKMDTKLLAEEPYHDIYETYLAMRMDYKNRETGEYAKSRNAFNGAWQTYADYYNRTHKPIALVTQFRY
jgi:hypothetical protein